MIAGNGNDEVDIEGTGTSGNIVAGNFIGTDATGTRAIPDQQGDGVFNDGVYLGTGPRRTGSGSTRRRHGPRRRGATSSPATAYDGVEIERRRG